MEEILAALELSENNWSAAHVVNLIQKSIYHKGLFNFAELYEIVSAKVSNMAELKTEVVSLWIRLLEIFSYGTWEDYRNLSNSHVIELDNYAQRKLKELTIVSLATHSSYLDFDMLRHHLDVEANDLEWLIIDSIYDGLISGKINTKSRYVEINDVQSRDPDPARLAAISLILKEKLSSTNKIIEETNSHIKHSLDEAAARTMVINAYNEQVRSMGQDTTAQPCRQ